MADAAVVLFAGPAPAAAEGPSLDSLSWTPQELYDTHAAEEGGTLQHARQRNQHDGGTDVQQSCDDSRNERGSNQVEAHFSVDGLPCKSKKDLVTAGVGLPRGVQYVVKMRKNEHREAAVRRLHTIPLSHVAMSRVSATL